MVALAQGGSIEGKVTDAESGELLRGATLGLSNVKKGAYSDTKGQFKIKKLAAGTYAIKASYVGYQSVTIENIEVREGQPTTVNVAMKPSRDLGSEVVVEATRSQDNADAVLAQRRSAAQVSDGISREEIAKLPDSDAGQSLKRVSGVTLVEGKYVYVRGVSERYNTTTLNGTTLSSTEPDKKAFAFDMFPSELLENANVAKSFTPDLPGNFSGGLVQLNTVEFPSAYSVKVSASQTSNDFVTFKSGQFLTYQGSASDWLAAGGADRSEPANLPTSRQQFLELNSAAQTGNEAAAQRVGEIGRSFHNQHWNTQYITAPTNGGLSLTLSAPFEVGEEDAIGLVANVNYSNAYSINRMERSAVQFDRALQFQKEGYATARSVNLGGLFNFSYKLGRANSFSWKNVYSRSMDDETLELYGESFTQGQIRREFGFNYVEKQLLSSQLGGEHTIESLGNSIVDWKLGYSETQRDEPDYRRLQYARGTYDPAGVLSINFSPSPIGDGTTAGRFYSTMSESYRNAAANWQIPMGSVKLKVGGLHENRTRSFSARSFTIIQSRRYQGDIDSLLQVSEHGQVNPYRAFADSNFSADRLMMSEETRLSDRYGASENLTAAYVMSDIPFTALSMKWRVIAGARVESSRQELTSFDVQDQPVNPIVDITDVLPSLNVVLSPMNEMNIRMSATQTLARPSLREFAPFSFYNFQIQAVTTGNPSLIRALVQNYDLRWEYFMNPGEVLSASLFYKTFKNAIEETVIPSTSELIYSFQNAQGLATNYGVELECRKQLGFISPSLSAFTVSLNAALINSNITVTQGGQTDTRQMWGQSPYTVNASIFYTNVETGTTINAGYNIAGARIIKVGQRGAYSFSDVHVYEMPRNVIDLSATQTVFTNMELKFAVKDLLNQPLYWQQGGVNIQSNIRGRSFNFGMSYRFR